MRFAKPALASAAALVAGVAFVLAQNPAPPSPTAMPPLKSNWGDLYLTTNIGSFKLVDGEGRVEINFTGTAMISQLKGTATPSAGLRKEYDDRGRQVWHGTGRLVVDGSFRGIQWFGTKMSARWVGAGLARISGEFDKNLETGYYWYGGRVGEKRPWNSSGMTIVNPEARAGGQGTPTERPKTGKPGGG